MNLSSIRKKPVVLPIPQLLLESEGTASCPTTELLINSKLTNMMVNCFI